MKRRRTIIAAAVFSALAACALLFGLSGESLTPLVEAGRPARTYPDIPATVIPPNIAPLNLRILEDGSKFRLRFIGARKGPDDVETSSSGGDMRIPIAAWRKLLAANSGHEILMDIYAKTGNAWTHFESVHLRVAAEPIDTYVVYRLMPPIYNWSTHLTLHQRNLTSFEDRVILDNERSVDAEGRTPGDACINCHTFWNGGASRMLFHMRAGKTSQIPAMILVVDGKAKAVDTRNGSLPNAGYTSWHPNGKLLAFSRNTVQQLYHTAGVETRDVVDRASALGFYNVETGVVFTIPQLSRSDRLETWPNWSPDGRYLYFCSAKVVWKDLKNGAFDYYDRIQYDLKRIAYDAATGDWGQVETVVAASDFGHSISQPVISPDGRYAMFVGHPYGSFPLFQPGSDLYMADLSKIAAPPVHFAPVKDSPAPDAGGSPGAPDSPPLATGAAVPRCLDELNSPQADTYHSWSSNGRWVIFVSKREDGVLARFYIAHLDETGHFGRPFAMPQEDPDSSGRTLLTFNRPEFLTEPVKVSEAELAHAMNSGRSAGSPPTPQPGGGQAHP